MWHGSRVMSPAVAALIRLAEAAYACSDPATYRQRWPLPLLEGITNPDRSQLMSIAAFACRDELHAAVQALSEVPDLAVFLPSGGSFGPTLVYPGGSMGQSFESFIVALLASAAQRFYFFRQESTVDAFIEAVIENCEDFFRQGRDEPIRVYDLIGYTGVELEPGQQVNTPWGILRAAPQNFNVGLAFNRTTAILAAPRKMKLKVSRESRPTQFPVDDLIYPSIVGARQLLPMAFALGSKQNPICAPMVTFETALLPLVELNSYRYPGILFPIQPTSRPSPQELRDTEAWAKRLEVSREGTLQIAERRLVSAIAQRSEKADALIDAVIAWESLVGPRNNPTSVVPEALANLIESDPAARPDLQRKLKKIYDTRSRVVHGDLADGEKVSAASSEAIRIGLSAVSKLHELSGDWLTVTSETRAIRLRSS